MVEAVRTTQSTFGIWAIVAVAMICLAAWLIGVYVADSHQTRLSRMRRRMAGAGPVLPEAEASAAAASIPGQRREAGQPEQAPAPETAAEGSEGGGQADAPTRPDLPAQAAPTGRHAMPKQRSGDTDRAERSYAGPDVNREDDQDQQ